MKKCTLCGEVKNFDFFYVQKFKGRPSGRFASACKTCTLEKRRTERTDHPERLSARRKEWREKNKDKINARYRVLGKKYYKLNPEKTYTSWIKSEYGLTKESHAAMFESQNGVCFICKKANKNGTRLQVDHDHATGKVRALLCSYCNSCLGMAKESIEVLSKMIEYLKHHENAEKKI